MPAKLRVAGVDRTLRCEGRVDEGTVRLTAMLPFLRIDGGVDVVLGENGEVAEHGVIKKIAVDPSTSDGVPRLAVDVVLANDTQPYGANRHVADTTPPPTRLPPACGHPLPSVLVSPGLVARSARRRGAAAAPARARHRRDRAPPRVGVVGLVGAAGRGEPPARARREAARQAPCNAG